MLTIAFADCDQIVNGRVAIQLAFEKEEVRLRKASLLCSTGSNLHGCGRCH